ncbi:hypothetical protein GSU68_17580 [Rathayibacter sp. VKM Ac-2759]|uniref:AraC-like ligand-binding domain-containing protein n=1 Tax=Rathayibacter sp. VKM Ac-2759 TaxID=2609252 RepID=UPI0013177103|nr:hypothetical protein [Rathayibacter sp. VKM Ac-2759]QHC68202.1 hypothetical protein GSU68_17580 [Rathayibacter sp. VKM Ac-2759]
MSMTTGATPTIERGVSRRDAAAAAWLAGAGMDTRPAGAFRVVADAFRGDDFEVIRLWHSAARLRRGGRPGQGVRVMIPLEGALVVQPDDPADDEVTLGPGAVAFLRCSEGATVVTDGPTARLEVMLGRPLLGVIGSQETGTLVTPADPASRAILLSTVNAFFGASLDADSAAFPLVRSAVEQLANAVLATSLPRESSETVFTRALAMIAGMSADPRLSVHEICLRLGVPKRTLQRVFATNGTTVFNEIRRARLTTARTLLGSTDTPPAPDHALSGYVRSQRLQRDLRHLDPSHSRSRHDERPRSA